jgi:threonine efflux protein
MPEWIHHWLVFVGVMALGQFSPGPDMLLLTRTALASGKKAGCATAIGIACGLGLHALVAVTGVAVLLGRGGWLMKAMLLLAAGYLVYLAVLLIRSGLRASMWKIDNNGLGGSFWLCWKRGLFCNLLNPKVAVFLAGVTAPFLSIKHPPNAWPLILWLTIVLEGLLLWCFWSAALQWPPIKMRYLKAAHWFDLAFGVALLGLAVFLLWSVGLLRPLSCAN